MSAFTLSRRSFVAAALAAGLPVPAFAEWPEAPAAALQPVLDAAGQVAALRALLVARDGQLVAERYYGGATPERPMRIHSATKSVCSVLVGQAIAQGKLRSLSQTVGELLPEAVARQPDTPAASLTLADIMGGTSGLRYDFRADFRALGGAGDPLQHVLALPREAAPRPAWSYNDAAISLLSPILERAHGMPLRDVARRDLAAPLGIQVLEWQRDRAGRELAYGGLSLRPRDHLKFAWAMVDGGRWHGRELVPAEWLAQSTRRRIAVDWGAPPMQEPGYGYLWFTGVLAGHPVAWSWGYGAQFAVLVPSLRLAIVTAAVEPSWQQLAAQNAAVMNIVAQVVTNAS
jgi:CubicO group peptidase (beta-lactamase class C family)